MAYGYFPTRSFAYAARMSQVAPRALVTGASSGIGHALARRLARRGIAVVVAARRRESLDQLVADIRRDGGQAEALTLDVEDAERTERVVRELGAARPFELVVANAGTGALTLASRPHWPDVQRVLTVNLLGAVATIYGALPGMLAEKRGRIVGISSLMGLGRALPGFSAYSASKAGLTVFLEAMSIDLARHGVGVTTVLPGFIKTEMTAKNRFKMPFLLDAEQAAEIIDRAIARGDRYCAFPLPTATVSRMLPLVPDSLYERLAKLAGRRSPRK